MPAPDSTIEEVRSTVLRYLRMYEEGHMTLGDLAAELAAMAPAYDHAMGGLDDAYQQLLGAACKHRIQTGSDGGLSPAEWEESVTRFRRTEAAW
ncbi:MAG TPA: hypothetical protein VNK82_02725 [Terriglobales bacterium]|nr:hypothetical protein [Terriglobales bacterium]